MLGIETQAPQVHDRSLEDYNDEVARILSESRTWFSVWFFCFILFIIYPIISKDRRGRRCLIRIRQRRWNVSLEGEEPVVQASQAASTNTASITERPLRTERGNSDEWNLKQILILEKLANFTLELNKDLFEEISSRNNDIESHWKEDGSVDSLLGENITLPIAPGQPISSLASFSFPSSCAICLCSYDAGDRICWSSNVACPHLFHEHCILQWLNSLLKKQRVQSFRRANSASTRSSSSARTDNHTRENTPSAPISENDATMNTSNDLEAGNHDSSSSEAPETDSGNSNGSSSEEEISDVENVLNTENEGNFENSENSLLESLPRTCPCCRRDFIVSLPTNNGYCKEIKGSQTSVTLSQSSMSSEGDIMATAIETS